MKLNHLAFLAVTSAFIATGSYATYAQGSVNQSSNTHTITIAQSQTVAASSGTFVAGEAPTTGTAKIVTENGQNFLEFDDAFSTSDKGPDLHVLLEPSAKPPSTYKNLSETINLGKLRSVKGKQQYPIPDAINLENYKSVVIWCRMANATFGYAPLK